MLSRRFPRALKPSNPIGSVMFTIHTPVLPWLPYSTRSHSSISKSKSSSPTQPQPSATPKTEPSSSASRQSQDKTKSPSPIPSTSPITLHYPDPPSPSHNDVATYLLYAARTGLSPKSTIYVGTLYEYTVASSLRRLGFDLRRIGGRSDGGIDLLGTWSVPSLPDPTNAPIRVICQCKAYVGTSKVGPQHVRELEGAFVAAPPGWRGVEAYPLPSSLPATSVSASSAAAGVKRGGTGSGGVGGGVVGILISQKPATKGVRESLQRSRWPMVYMAVSKDGKVMQMLWNWRAEQEGLVGMGVGVQHTETEGVKDEDLVLTWHGLPYAVGAVKAEE